MWWDNASELSPQSAQFVRVYKLAPRKMAVMFRVLAAFIGFPSLQLIYVCRQLYHKYRKERDFYANHLSQISLFIYFCFYFLFFIILIIFVGVTKALLFYFCISTTCYFYLLKLLSSTFTFHLLLTPFLLVTSMLLTTLQIWSTGIVMRSQEEEAECMMITMDTTETLTVKIRAPASSGLFRTIFFALELVLRGSILLLLLLLLSFFFLVILFIYL